MKFIFDFDDVLFYKGKFNEKILSDLEEVGISRNTSEEYLKKERQNCFSLKKMLAHFSVPESIYEKIMSDCKNFANKELLEIVKKINKENCSIVTYGDNEYQMDKIKKSGFSPFFSEIMIVSGSKKGAVENVCAKFSNEDVIFIDDKAFHFQNLDFQKYQNLKTILFDEQGLQKIIAILPQS